MADNQSSLVEPSLRFAKKLECSQSGVVALEWWAGWSGQTDKRMNHKRPWQWIQGGAKGTCDIIEAVSEPEML